MFLSVYRSGATLSTAVRISAAAIVLFGLSSVPTAAQVTSHPKLAGEEFENIHVLGEMPAEQMGKVMNIMSESLGVGCNYCHENYDFAKEGIERKDIAREMLAMTFKLNQDYFQGNTQVSCNTCHRGKPHPESKINLQTGAPDPQLKQPSPPPKVQNILAKYFEALGGRKNLDSIQNRKITAERIEPDGRTEPETLWQTAAGKTRTLTRYTGVDVVEGFDGKQSWKNAGGQSIPLKADEGAQIAREAWLAFPGHHQDYFENFEFVGLELLGDREVYVLASSESERLKFDVENGLLVNRTLEVPTILGQFTYQVDYQNYERFGGVSVPTRIVYAVPGIHWVRKIVDVESNVELDASLFREN